MNILVILRTVLDPAGFTVNRKAQKVFINRERFIVNPADRNALEAALALAGADDSITVTVAALGGQATREALQMARALGAQRAVSVAAPAGLDAFRLTQVFQALIGHLGGVDLVLLGADVLDADTAQVGARLAAALDWRFVADAWQVSAAPEGFECVVARYGGYRRLGVDLPAVATLARDGNRPRFAPAAQIITAFTDPDAVEMLSLDDLALSAADLSSVTNQHGESFPPERTLGQLLAGDQAVRQIAAALRGR